MPAIELIRPLRLTPTGGTELTILNRGSNNVFYGQSPTVSSTNKTGELAVGESLTLSRGYVWVVAEATPSIVDLKEKEKEGAGSSEGITKAEADLRYERLLALAESKTVTTATVKLPEVTTATITILTLKSSPTIELPGAVAGKSLEVLVKQDSSGSRVPTFEGVRWPEGTLPTFSTAASAEDVVVLKCYDGTHWLGFFPGPAMA